MTGATLYKKSI